MASKTTGRPGERTESSLETELRRIVRAGVEESGETAASRMADAAESGDEGWAAGRR